MQMCPDGHVYDESEYSRCPYCSGELEREPEKFKNCECGGYMYWDSDQEHWECYECGAIDNESDEDDYDGICE